MKLTLLIAFVSTASCFAQTVYIPAGTSGIGTSSNGNVGIGIASPTSTLDVYSAVNTTLSIRNEPYTNGYSLLQLDTKKFASPGNNAGLVANSSGADVFGIPSETFGVFSRWRPMVFGIGDGSGNTYERMRIQQNGRVGIGTNNPEAMLDVYQHTGASFRVRNADNEFGTAEVILEAKRFSGGNRAGIIANAANGGAPYYGISSGTFGIFSQWRPMVFAIGDGSGNTYERVRIAQDGRMGIGTSSPEAMLDVYQTTGGSIRVRNNDSEFGTAEVILEAKRLSGGNRAGIIANAMNGNVAFGIPSGTFGIFSQSRPMVFAVGNGVDTYETMRITQGGNLLIGKTAETGSYKLDVNGRVRSNEIVVNTDGADFVFKNDYQLMPLKELEQFIEKHDHLPGIAPADEMQQNGMAVGEFQTQLLQKVEELTLYMIAQQKQIEKLISENARLRESNSELEKQVKVFTKQTTRCPGDSQELKTSKE